MNPMLDAILALDIPAIVRRALIDTFSLPGTLDAILGGTVLVLVFVAARLLARRLTSKRDAPARTEEESVAQPFGDSGRYIRLGLTTIVLLLGSLGVWAGATNLSGAVIAGGVLVVDSYVKKVQHPSGGVVGEIRVREGDRVKAGDLLVRLDETVTRANLQMVTKQLDEIRVSQARLKAERDGAAKPDFPPEILARSGEAHVGEILASERSLFESRLEARESEKGQLRERSQQLTSEIGGLTAQLEARKKELAFARHELEGLELLEQQQLVSTPKITAARRVAAQLEGDVAQVQASIAQARGRIAEIELQLLRVDHIAESDASTGLRELQGKEAEYAERRVAADDQLRRIEIRAPQSGTVHQLAVHTVGGLINQSEPLMLIVPDSDRLVIETRVAPQDIDQIHVGASADVRFLAFDRHRTPEIPARVSRISADLVTEAARADSAGGAQSYYVARLEIGAIPAEFDGKALVPGMPVEVHIKTADRRAISYLTKPVTDQFARAFRER